MRKSIGYGAYNGFGYADEPQWGLFNPAQSLFRSEPTIYGSLFATNRDTEGSKQGRSQRRGYNPGLPQEVGPRKAWKRSKAASLYGPKGTNSTSGMTEQSDLDGYGEESSTADTAKAAGLMMTPMLALVAVIVLMKLFNTGG